MRRLAVLVALAPLAAGADAPLPPPSRVVACSPSGAVCAVSDPADGRTTHSGRQAWTIDGWHRWLFVADDGESLAVGYAGMNLVPLASGLHVEVLRLHHRGRLVRAITLADLYTDPAQLKRTVSHLAWVNSIRVEPGNRLVMELVSGRTLAFDMRTGQVARE